MSLSADDIARTGRFFVMATSQVGTACAGGHLATANHLSGEAWQIPKEICWSSIMKIITSSVTRPIHEKVELCKPRRTEKNRKEQKRTEKNRKGQSTMHR